MDARLQGMTSLGLGGAGECAARNPAAADVTGQPALADIAAGRLMAEQIVTVIPDVTERRRDALRG